MLRATAGALAGVGYLAASVGRVRIELPGDTISSARRSTSRQPHLPGTTPGGVDEIALPCRAAFAASATTGRKQARDAFQLTRGVVSSHHA